MAAATNFEFRGAKRLEKFKGGTVWEEFTPLAHQYNAVNLGQGFPNFSGPDWVLDAAKNAIDDGKNQYARSAGHLPLVEAIGEVYSPLFGRELDSKKEILTTNGSSEGIFASVMGLVDVGDEIVMIEPFFDIYNGAIAMSNATPRYVPLRPKEGTLSTSADLILHQSDLEAAINEKTRLLVLNTPHNPTGKVFSRAELEMIAGVVSKHPHLMVLADEVYEWLTFEVPHIRFATLPGMWERTITATSAGKTFSVTGWKTGWLVGPEHLVSAAACAHAYIPFCIATPFQEGVAHALSNAKKHGYFDNFQDNYKRKRDILVEGLKKAGLKPLVPQGSFFVLADISNLEIPDGIGSSVTATNLFPNRRDWNACRYLISEIGVAAIPPSSFYCEEHQDLVPPYIRFAFCKTDEELHEACRRLLKLVQK
eukprot:CAMPEP_0119124300 /NCGR_PEP_ID=MMETSP1310-20130426/3970_1 /TAXON_ID=464262 /ORGANISM="Genus nov. species nov., Strain RCC2339" /LENGTH=422 /DNA_ID=CAMNT_0007114233 /DNA_START=189 /DNA_END=1457 /DNA_ORIENTATION=+